MIKILTPLLVVVLLSGCSVFGFKKEEPPKPPEVVVITETVKTQIYQPPMPPPLRFDEIRWYAITRDNIDEKIEEVENVTGSDFVVFGMTTQSYENMAYNFQETRRYILQLIEIINYYREATKPGTTEDWLKENGE
jgi:hypothetical protein